MKKRVSLGAFFALVFAAVGLLAFTWIYFSRDNFTANQREEGVDVAAPYYQDVEIAGSSEQHGHESAKPGENKVEGGETMSPDSGMHQPKELESGQELKEESEHK
jgi:hypothetical protein